MAGQQWSVISKTFKVDFMNVLVKVFLLGTGFSFITFLIKHDPDLSEGSSPKRLRTAALVHYNWVGNTYQGVHYSLDSMLFKSIFLFLI